MSISKSLRAGVIAAFSVASAVCGAVAAPAVGLEGKPLTLTRFSIEPTAATIFKRETRSAGQEGFDVVNLPYQSPFTQAGGHPWALTTVGEFATEPTDAGAPEASRDAKDIVVNLPPGLLGDPLATPRCPLSFVTGTGSGQCPASTQIGVFRIILGTAEVIGPIVNVVPEPGQSAELALEGIAAHIAIPLLTAHLVHTPEGYGFSVTDNGIPRITLRRFELTFWGVPEDPSHDPMRGFSCKLPEPEHFAFSLSCETAGGQPPGAAAVPFVTMPTDCAAGPETATVRADSWQEPGVWTTGETSLQAATNCGTLQFNAGTGVEAKPDTLMADTPVGLGVNLRVPQSEAPGQNATPLLRRTSVTLPAGLSISPGVVNGIQACNAAGPEGIDIEGPESERAGLNGEPQLAPGHCPNASIVGEAEAITPDLPEPVKGHVYLARPGCGGAGQAACTEQDAVDGNLYKLYLELGGTGAASDAGIEFKVPLDTQANPATGQLTAVADGLVQAPYSEVRIRLNGGPRAPLNNPAACGSATTSADFTPWSAPGVLEGAQLSGTPDLLSSSFFDVDLAGDGLGTPCPSLPFAPGFAAGTVSPQAGQFSSFTLNLTRGDREQYVKGLQVHTPPGLLAMLSSVPLCSEAQANDPAAYGECTASKIGTARVASGAGSHPFEIAGNVYLTGPYENAPFGLSIVTHAVAGPFDLGLVVVRARIDIDPTDSTATITTDETGSHKLPQIVFGVPLRLKKITVNIDRPGFMFNPTGCRALTVTANVAGSANATAAVSSPFAAASCRSLAFKPQFSVATNGHTSRVDGASLDAKVSYPAGSMGKEANIAYVKVELPKQLPSRLPTLQKACLAAIFDADPASCPPQAVIGTVRASTPVLAVPLAGPVYFVSHGGEAFPSLVAVLQGDGVRVNLTGTTFISSAGVTSSTFKTVPDVPIDSFELYLPEGPYSALAATTNLCKLATTRSRERRVTTRVHGRLVRRTVTTKAKAASLSVPTEFVAQNGAVMRQDTQIAVTGCGKPKAAASPHAKKTRKGPHR